jgi:hypothetical protein
MTFLTMFLIALYTIIVYKIGKALGRRRERKDHELTLDKMTKTWEDATARRRITLLGGPPSGQEITFSEAELKRADNQLVITADLPDGTVWRGKYTVQGDVGIYWVEEVEG